MNWTAESLHAVVFHTPSTEIPDSLQPWLKIFGKSPQTLQNSNPGTPPTSTAMGKVGDYSVNLIAQVGRIELVLNPENDQSDGRPPQITKVPDAAEILREYTNKIIHNIENIARLAFVIKLVKFFETNSESNKCFSESTKLKEIPECSTDLQFGINVPQNIEESTIRLNRLSRWSTGVNQIIEFKMVGGTASPPKMHIQELPVCNWVIDVNTHPKTPIGEENAELFLNFCAKGALDIFGKGYDYIL